MACALPLVRKSWNSVPPRSCCDSSAKAEAPRCGVGSPKPVAGPRAPGRDAEPMGAKLEPMGAKFELDAPGWRAPDGVLSTRYSAASTRADVSACDCARYNCSSPSASGFVMLRNHRPGQPGSPVPPPTSLLTVWAYTCGRSGLRSGCTPSRPSAVLMSPSSSRSALSSFEFSSSPSRAVSMLRRTSLSSTRLSDEGRTLVDATASSPLAAVSQAVRSSNGKRLIQALRWITSSRQAPPSSLRCCCAAALCSWSCNSVIA